jgi:hypothetical protein
MVVFKCPCTRCCIKCGVKCPRKIVELAPKHLIGSQWCHETKQTALVFVKAQIQARCRVNSLQVELVLLNARHILLFGGEGTKRTLTRTKEQEASWPGPGVVADKDAGEPVHSNKRGGDDNTSYVHTLFFKRSPETFRNHQIHHPISMTIDWHFEVLNLLMNDSVLTVGIPEIWELHYHKNLRSGPNFLNSLLSL